MDISAISANERTIDILHPATGEPTGLKVTLLPGTDEKVESARRKITNRRLQSRSQKITAEQLEAEGMELLLASVSGWEWGEATLGGEQPEFSADNVRRVLKQHKWIRDQIDREAGYSEAFFGA